MTVSTLPAGVGWTSLLTAYGRAQEAREERPQFADPLAAAFVAAALNEQGAETAGGGRLPRLGPARDDGSSTLWEDFRFYFAQRTPFYDRWVRGTVDAGCRQVAVLGAGLDTRAFRLGLPPDTAVFEVDQAPVLDFKARVLEQADARPTCRRTPLAADLLTGELERALTGAGFDPSLPTLWVVEGLLMYFTRAAADRLLDAVTALSAPGSRLLGEYFPRHWTNDDVAYDTLDAEERAAWDLLMAAFRYGPVDEAPADWLAAHGWQAEEVTTVVTEGRAAGRPVPADFARAHGADVWLFAGSLG